jgi:TonB family protein
VKTNLRTAVLAVSLGLALPTGAEPVKAREQASPMLDATVSLLRELQGASDPKLPLHTAFEHFEAFRPTPATAAKLRAAFGTDHPYLFARQPDKDGRPAWRATLLPLHVQSGTGTTVDWDAALADFTLDKSDNGLDVDASWPRLTVSDSTAHMTMSGMTLHGRQQRGDGGVWYGGGRFGVASVRLDGAQGEPMMEMRDLRTEVSTTEHPKTAAIGYDARIGAIVVAGERIEEAHVGIRIVNIDKKLLAAAKAASDRQQAQGAPVTPPTPEQRLAAMKPWLRALGQSALGYGTAVEIDDISARFHGNTASLHGRIELAGARADELDDLKMLARRIVAHFEIKVPLALVRDVAGIVAAKQAAAQAAHGPGQGKPAQATPPDAQMGQTIADVIVGKLVGGGFAKVENDALVSTLEWRDGQLSANGKPVALPTVPAGAAAPAAPPLAFSETVSAGPGAPVPAEPLPDDALQARLVDGSCRLPDYPDEVVRANAPLRAVLTWRVDAAGKVRDAAIERASPFPAWDAAALAALSQCAYIPALKDGQPFEVPMRWTVVREAGTAHP